MVGMNCGKGFTHIFDLSIHLLSVVNYIYHFKGSNEDTIQGTGFSNTGCRCRS